MQLQKDIPLPHCRQSLSVVYTEEYYDGKDTAITVYDRYKISILLSDGLHAIAGDQLICCSKGGALFFRPDELHFGHFSSAGIHAYLDFFIPTDFFCGFQLPPQALAFLEERSSDRIHYVPASKATETIAKDAVALLRKEAATSSLPLLALALQVISYCSSAYETQKSAPKDSHLPAVVTKTIAYLSEHFDRKLSLSELAANAGCSVTYLSRTFKRYTGKTVYHYVTATRIMNAQRMLKAGTSVTEACFASGFEDCSGFIRTFKRITGETPLKYKTK